MWIQGLEKQRSFLSISVITYFPKLKKMKAFTIIRKKSKEKNKPD